MSAEDAGAAPAPNEAAGWVVARNAGPGFATEIRSGAHAIVADEPVNVGGADLGPTPYDFLLASIGACTAMTLRMYASRKQWPLDEAVVALRTARSHAADCADCAERPSAIGPLRLERRVELRGDLTAEQRARLLDIANRCPVKLALQRGVEITA